MERLMSDLGTEELKRKLLALQVSQTEPPRASPQQPTGLQRSTRVWTGLNQLDQSMPDVEATRTFTADRQTITIDNRKMLALSDSISRRELAVEAVSQAPYSTGVSAIQQDKTLFNLYLQVAEAYAFPPVLSLQTTSASPSSTRGRCVIL